MTPPSQANGYRMVPVQGGRYCDPNAIPWHIHVRAWQVYAALGHGQQSAERIAERGGFGHGELIAFLAEHDIRPGGMTPLDERQQQRLEDLRASGATSIR